MKELTNQDIPKAFGDGGGGGRDIESTATLKSAFEIG